MARRHRVLKVNFVSLREIGQSSFIRRLITLPRHIMDSVGTGLGAGQTSIRIAGLSAALTAGAGATATLTLAGTVVVSAVGGIIGILAITVGILGLQKKHKKNKQDIKAIVGTPTSHTGKDVVLKEQIAYLTANIDAANPEDLGEILFLLHGIQGDNLTSKLCNLYDIEYSSAADSFDGLIDMMQQSIGGQTLARENLHKLNTAHQTKLRAVKEELQTLLSPDQYYRDGNAKNEAQLNHFINELSQLPGDNLIEKLASLYDLPSVNSRDTRDLINQLNDKQRDLKDQNDYSNLAYLEKALKKTIENQYLDILLLKANENRPKTPEEREQVMQFKRALSLLNGIDYDNKLDSLFNVGFFGRTSGQFNEMVKNHAKTRDLIQGDPAQLDRLVAAKKDFDDEELGASFRPFTLLKDFFASFTGSLTGFGIFLGIAMLAGFTIGTSGVGLGILIGAIVSAAIGFSIAYLVRRYTTNYTSAFKKNIETTSTLVDNVTEKAKALNNEIERQHNSVAQVEAGEAPAPQLTQRATPIPAELREPKNNDFPPGGDKGKEEEAYPTLEAATSEPKIPKQPDGPRLFQYKTEKKDTTPNTTAPPEKKQALRDRSNRPAPPKHLAPKPPTTNQQGEEHRAPRPNSPSGSGNGED